MPVAGVVLIGGVVCGRRIIVAGGAVFGRWCRCQGSVEESAAECSGACRSVPVSCVSCAVRATGGSCSTLVLCADHYC